jgi:ribosome maturation protein Sdo1
MIQKALDEIGFSVRADKSAKSQALEGIKKLVDSKVIPIQRARMRLRVVSSGGSKVGKKLREKLNEAGVLGEIQEENFGEEYELVLPLFFAFSAEDRAAGMMDVDGRLLWLILGSIGVFRILCLLRRKGMDRWRYWI